MKGVEAPVAGTALRAEPNRDRRRGRGGERRQEWREAMEKGRS